MIEIIPYQEKWPLEFQDIAAKLRAALGGLALRIDHIGSTSVLGLAAKDVIDIQITVAALDPAVQNALTGIGYIQSGAIRRDHCPPSLDLPENEWEKWFFNPPPGQRRTHVHVRVRDRANQRYALLFRDFLRAHPATAAAYAQLKTRLAHSLANPDTYPVVKDPAVDLIYLAAEDWAESMGWEAEESDS